MKLIIKKEADGLFTFNESSDGVEYDGVSYGSTSVRLNWFNDTLTVNDGKEIKEYDIVTQVNYDDGNEIIGFASTIECITALKNAGFTGNFNTAGATAIISVENQDDTDGLINLVVIKDTTSVKFLPEDFNRAGEGIITCEKLFRNNKIHDVRCISFDFAELTTLRAFPNQLNTYYAGIQSDFCFSSGGYIIIDEY